MATGLKIALEPTGGASITKVHGGYPTNTTSWGAEVHLGSCNYGQSRDFVVTMTVPNTEAKYLEATLTYCPTGATDSTRMTGELANVDQGLEVDVQKFRCQFT